MASAMTAQHLLSLALCGGLGFGLLGFIFGAELTQN